MSTGAWIRRQRDRPIAEGERRAAMAAVVVLLTATALLLALTRPGRRPQPTTAHPSPGLVGRASAAQASAREPTTGPLTPALARAATLFLAGYLGYLYGHTPARQVKGATAALLRSLEAHPPRVSTSMRSRAPRLLSLHSAPAPSGLVGVSALVNDGGLIDYPIGLVLAPHGGRLLVTGLDGE
jgi:hypothetical protein